MGMKTKGRPMTWSARQRVTWPKEESSERRVRLKRPSGDGEVADRDHEAWIEFAEGAAGDEHHDHHDEAGGREGHAGAFGGVAEQRLEVLRDEDGGAEEDHAEDELEEDGGAEVSVLEEAEVDDGVGVAPLPDDKGDEEDGGDDGGGA